MAKHGCCQHLGPNGAGKTTTIRLLLGLHRPSAGRAELRHLSAQTIEVTFDGPVPSLDDVHVVSAGANALRLEVSGPVGPLIDALAGHPVLALSSREPSLEEIFLHHYEDTGAVPARAPSAHA